nr:serine hydrolase domain-containing protein [Kordiimonas marina]
MSSYGVVYDGTLYAGACTTRLGPYPHCGALTLPSYSLAKSLAAGLGLMRLEALYPGAFDAKVADYVPQCALKRWRGVTFGDLLNMTTGNYGTATPHVDEGAADYMPFFDVRTAADKTAFACTHFKHRSKPGKKWVYHTSDTYLLGVAMNAYLRARTGKPSDFYRDLVRPIWHKLNLSPLMDIMRRTEGADAQDFTGYGMVFNRDDIARTASWLATGGVPLRGLFATPALDAALQRAPKDRGLPAGADTLRYKNGFWAWNARKTLGCRKDTWLPFLSGYGGISVVMLPNGAAYYYVSDSGVHAFAAPIRELSKITPICKESHD